MADSNEEVLTFLNDIAKHAKPMAKEEVEALRKFAKSTFGVNELQAWDYSYFSEKLKQDKFEISLR